MERTLLVIKPDGVARGLVGDILSRLERKGIFITALKLMELDEEKARALYCVHVGRSFYEPLIAYITSGPLVACIAEGQGVIRMVRNLAGPTFGSDAAGGTIRGDLAVSKRFNIVHASDSTDSFNREYPVFFTDDEIVDLPPERLNWIYDTSGDEIV